MKTSLLLLSDILIRGLSTPGYLGYYCSDSNKKANEVLNLINEYTTCASEYWLLRRLLLKSESKQS